MATAKHKRRRSKPQHPLVRKLTSFAMVGIFVMVVGLALLTVCVEYLHMSPQRAYLLQAFVSIELNFVLNYLHTWGKRGKTEAQLAQRERFWPALVKFHLTKLYTVPINQFLFMGLMRAPVPEMVTPTMHAAGAHIICVGVSSALMFVSADKVVFVRGRWPRLRDLWPFGRKNVGKTPSAQKATPAEGGKSDKGTTVVGEVIVDPPPAVRSSSGPTLDLGNPVLWPHMPMQEQPWISVIIPVKNGDEATAQTARALLDQHYRGHIEVIVVGSKNDTVREHLTTFREFGANHLAPRSLKLLEVDVKSPGRDSNCKRSIGLQEARMASNILSVMDADVIPEPNWAMEVAHLIRFCAPAVAGPVSGIGDGFWTRYIDLVPAGRKMPSNVETEFVLDTKTIKRRKPMVTANFAFSRELYEEVGGPAIDFTRSYEDYEWMSRMIQHGAQIICSKRLACTRYHREGFKPLSGEYLRSGRGCSDHVVRHRLACAFAQRRARQLLTFYLVVATLVVVAVLAPLAILAVGALASLGMTAHSYQKVRRLEAVVYPFITLFLSLMFIRGLTSGLWERRVLRRPFIKPTVFGPPEVIMPPEGHDPASTAKIRVIQQPDMRRTV